MVNIFVRGVAFLLAFGSVFPSVSAAPVSLSAISDATVRRDFDERKNDNYGRDPFLSVGGNRYASSSPYGAADGLRSLILFDLSSVSGPVSRATLELTLAIEVGAALRIDIHPIVASGSRTPWVEGNGDESLTVSRVFVDDAYGVAWSGAGDNPSTDALNNQTQPNFAPDPIASTLLEVALAKPGSIVTWDITALVNEWILGVVPNFGVTLVDSLDTEPIWSAVAFGSKDGEQLSKGRVLGPRLVLNCEQPPCTEPSILPTPWPPPPIYLPEPESASLLGSVLTLIALFRGRMGSRKRDS